MRFWIGARGADMGEQGAGITAVTAGEPDSPLAGGGLADRGLAVEAPSPTWLAPHPRLDVLYAALEGSGRVAVYRRTGETALEPLGTSVGAGEAVCHIAVAPDGSRLVASCWGDGRVVHVPLLSDGSLGEPALAKAADDPYGVGGVGPDWVSAGVDLGVVAEAERAALAAAGPGDDAHGARSGEPEAPAADTATELPSGILVPGAGDIAGLLASAGGSADAVGDLMRALEDAQSGGAEVTREEAQRIAAEVAERTSADADGAADATQGAHARSPAAPRPTRAHSAAFLPDGRVATTDLGYDLVRIWRVAPSGLVADHEVVLPFGVGPRHMVVHPSGHLHVVTEFSCEVWTLAQGPDARWRVVASVSTGAQRGDTAAELAPSRDRGFLYAGLRGSDALSVLRVTGAGDRLEPTALVDSGIRVPRHHAIVRDTLLVAGQESDEIASLSLDERTGVPGRVRHRLETPTPQHILPTA